MSIVWPACPAVLNAPSKIPPSVLPVTMNFTWRASSATSALKAASAVPPPLSVGLVPTPTNLLGKNVFPSATSPARPAQQIIQISARAVWMDMTLWTPPAPKLNPALTLTVCFALFQPMFVRDVLQASKSSEERAAKKESFCLEAARNSVQCSKNTLNSSEDSPRPSSRGFDHHLH